MLSTTSSVACSVSARSTGRIACFQVAERSDGVVRPHELTSKSIEHGGGVAVGLDGDERRATDLVRAHHPAGELGSERGLAFAALTAHHSVALVAQQPLEREQLAAASDEPVSGTGGSAPSRVASAP